MLGHIVAAQRSIGQRTLLKITFERMGYTIVITTERSEMMAALAECQADLAIIDKVLGDEGDFEAALEVRSLYPNLPIMICDYYITEADIETARQLGFPARKFLGASHEAYETLHRMMGRNSL